MIDVATAAYRVLKADSGTLVAVGLHPADTDWIEPWIFTDRPQRSIEGTGLCSITVSSPNGWTSPNRHNTAQFPSLQIEVYADPDRFDDQGPEKGPEDRVKTAISKAHALYAVIDGHFHRVDEGGFDWDELRIVSSVRNSEPEISDVPEGDMVKRLLVRYAVQVG